MRHGERVTLVHSLAQSYQKSPFNQDGNTKAAERRVRFLLLRPGVQWACVKMEIGKPKATRDLAVQRNSKKRDEVLLLNVVCV